VEAAKVQDVLISKHLCPALTADVLELRGDVAAVHERSICGRAPKRQREKQTPPVLTKLVRLFRLAFLSAGSVAISGQYAAENGKVYTVSQKAVAVTIEAKVGEK
jgi:hypothetical protein